MTLEEARARLDQEIDLQAKIIDDKIGETEEDRAWERGYIGGLRRARYLLDDIHDRTPTDGG